MTITLSAAAQTAARNAACDAIVGLVDAGAGAGTLVLQTAALAEVATVTFATTAFAASINGTATAAAMTADSDATGSASAVTNFSVQDSNLTEVWTGAVAESGSDLNIDDGTPGGGVIIATNAVVSITSLTLTVSFV